MIQNLVILGAVLGLLSAVDDKTQETKQDLKNFSWTHFVCEKYKQQTLPLGHPKAYIVHPVLTGQFDSYFIPTVSNGPAVQPGGGASRQYFFN